MSRITQTLVRHPDTPCEAVQAITIDARRGMDGSLRVNWRVAGDVAKIVMPKGGTSARRDGLWMTTCFEVFAKGPGGGYREFNLSPSSDWAAYAFTGPREGMAELPGEPVVRFSMMAFGSSSLQVESQLDLRDLAAKPIAVAITAVIEEVGGRKSYWALAHPPGAADFHHGDGFALELAAV